MNTTMILDEKTSSQPDNAVLKSEYKVPWRNMGISLFLLCLLLGPYKYYQHTTAFTTGLDSFEPQFEVYWMNLLYAQFVFIGLLSAVVFGYIWVTRDRDLANLSPSVEVQRYVNLLAWLVVYLLTIFFLGVIFTESDAAWHQVTVRDTDFTPTHIPIFYLCVPLFIVAGVASFVWARTRLPEFANRISIPFVLLITGPFMIMPNVGFNEWGHTFFYAEELFSAPIHWGFVVLGWASMAAGGLLMQIFRRVSELVGSEKSAAEYKK